MKNHRIGRKNASLKKSEKRGIRITTNVKIRYICRLEKYVEKYIYLFVFKRNVCKFKRLICSTGLGIGKTVSMKV